jgi:hypothetical protein
VPRQPILPIWAVFAPGPLQSRTPSEKVVPDAESVRRRERGHRGERPAALRPEASAAGGGLLERLGFSASFR